MMSLFFRHTPGVHTSSLCWKASTSRHRRLSNLARQAETMATSVNKTQTPCSICSTHKSVSLPLVSWRRSTPFIAGHVNKQFTSTQATTQERIGLQDGTITTQTIDDLDTQYCDDFQCQSSPAIEQTVRSMARDFTRLRFSSKLFQPDCTYSDGFRNFTGSDKLAKQKFFAENVKGPLVDIQNMRMLEKNTAQIQWRIKGDMGGKADIDVTSEFEMNQLTGRVTKYKETWDLSRLSPPQAAMATLNRMVWSLRASSQDISSNINNSLSSMDDSGSSAYNNNPTDPTRFFFNQGGNEQWNDYVSYATLAALLYLAFKAFGELEKLG